MRWKQASQGNCKELRGLRREGRRKKQEESAINECLAACVK